MARNLAAQVSFNHEKRQGWERPVLEDINNRRAGLGLAAVDKLTIQVNEQGVCGGGAAGVAFWSCWHMQWLLACPGSFVPCVELGWGCLMRGSAVHISAYW